MPSTITLQQLIDANACLEQRTLFKKLFGESVEISKSLAVKHAQDFHWDWAANNLLNQSARAEYDKTRASARAEYDKTRASARAEYNKSIASALVGYDKTRASARAEYNKSMASALVGYNKAVAFASVEYYKAIALAFVRLYLAMQQRGREGKE